MMLSSLAALSKVYEGARNSYVAKGDIATVQNPSRREGLQFLQILMTDMKSRNAKNTDMEAELIAAFYGALMLIADEAGSGRLHSALTSLYELTQQEKVRCFMALNDYLAALTLKETGEVNPINPFVSTGSLSATRLEQFLTRGFMLECKERKEFMKSFAKDGVSSPDLAQYKPTVEIPKIFIDSLGTWYREDESCVKEIPQAIKESESLKTAKPNLYEWPDARRIQQVSFLLKLSSILSAWQQGNEDQKAAILLGACLVIAQVIANEGNRNSNTQTEIHQKTLYSSLNPKNKESLIQAFYDFCRFMTTEDEKSAKPKIRTQNPFGLESKYAAYDMDAFVVLMPVAQDMIRDTRTDALSINKPAPVPSSYSSYVTSLVWAKATPAEQAPTEETPTAQHRQ